MHRTTTKVFSLAIAAVALLGACDRADTLGPGVDADFTVVGTGTPRGAVYTITNASAGNEVVAFTRTGDGTLTPAGSYATGGLGSGGGLGNQGSLALTSDHKFLFVVNAGSDEISSFAIHPDGLELVDRVSSGGTRPVSLTAYHDLLYVLNAGADGNITGFRIAVDGSLAPLANSTRPLSGAEVTGAAQIAFSRNGEFLAVSEKASNLIDIYIVDGAGLASEPIAQPSSGQTPFGLSFGLGNVLVVSEAAGGSAGGASASSYRVTPDGILEVATGTLENTQTAACWAAVSRDGRFAYTSNTPSNTISGYRIDATTARLSLLDADGRTVVTNPGDRPLDIAFSTDGRHLYALNSGVGSIGGYLIAGDGSLTHLGDTDPVVLPGVANGIAAW